MFNKKKYALVYSEWNNKTPFHPLILETFENEDDAESAMDTDMRDYAEFKDSNDIDYKNRVVWDDKSHTKCCVWDIIVL